MAWDVEYTDAFEAWWTDLPAEAQVRIEASVQLLERFGPALGFPHSSKVRGAQHGALRELRVQWDGAPLRILYAFDPRRVALLLLGGDKTGDDRFYERLVPQAEALYAAHLRALEEE